MNKELYKNIFKRKSFHLFRNRNEETISKDDIKEIVDTYNSFTPLVENIKTEIKIVKGEETSCKRGEEYCILFFSEKKDHYLQNIGYLGELLDLYLVNKNIGTLWFGIAKSNEVYHGLDYVIMMGIAKMDEDKFRKDMYKAKRKELADIWQGDDLGIGNIVRFTPSACNSQPWLVTNKDNILTVYRKSKSGKVGIMPKNAAVYFNQIDIGIFLAFLDLCLDNKNIKYERTVYIDNQSFDEPVKYAEYRLSFLENIADSYLT